MKLKITVIITIIIGVFTIVGSLVAFDDRYAKYNQLCKVELRLEQKITLDRIYNLQERMWRLEDRYGSSITTSEEYRNLKQEKELLDRQLKQR